MKKFDINLLAALTIICTTFLLIAAMYFTSFERHHTHDWPSKQRHSQDVTPPESDMMTGPLIQSKRSSSKYEAKGKQNSPAYTNSESLEHYNHKAQIFIAVFTFLGLIIAGFGLYLIGRTLVETRKATKSANLALIEAKNATKAAWASVENGRAWIVLNNIDYTPIDVIGNLGEKIRTDLQMVFHWGNCGQTPAKNFRFNIEKFLVPNGEGIPTRTLDFLTAATPITVGPNQSKSTAPLVLSESELNDIRNRIKDCYIFGKVWYETIYGVDIKISEFCYQYSIVQPPMNPVTRKQEVAQNTTRPVGEHNRNT